MADEPAVAEAPVEPDTPSAAPEEGTPAEQTAPESDPYQKRYEDLQPEYTRATQEAAEYRRVVALAQEGNIEAMEALGIPFEQPPAEDPNLADPMEEIQKIRQELQQRDEAAQAEQFDKLEAEYIDKTVGEIEAKEGIELTKKEYDIVVNNALANRLEDDRPDLEGSFADLKEIQGAARDRYAASKQAAPPPIGTPGEDKIDLSDPDARRKYAAEVYEAQEGAENT